MSVRRPRLLDRDLNEIDRLCPKAQSVTLTATPLSTGSVALLERSGARVRDYVEAYTARGSAGIFRVVSKESGYGTGGDMLSLEHGICVLGDAVTPSEGEITGTYREIFEALLGYQTATARGAAMWTLGDCDVPGEATHEYQGDDTLSAILTVLEGVQGYGMELDQSGFPWVMHIRKLEETPSCEGRLSRNVKTARIVMDESEICTRVECSRLPGGYMQLEEDPQWGIVTRRLEFTDEMSDSEVESECRKYLEARKEPRVSIEMDALELSSITGEALDRFDPGKLMRLALADYGLTVNERIVSMTFAEAIGRPLEVTVTLSTALRDAGNSLSRLNRSVDSLKSTATSYGNRISSSEKSITNLKDTAEGFAEVDEKIMHWFNAVEIDLNAEEAQLGAIASRKELTESNLKINEAFLILDGDTEEGGSRVGLVSRVTQNEADIEGNAIKINSLSEAYVTLESTTTESFAQIGARVDDNEASLTATATTLGTRIDLKADKTYVDTLVAEEIEAALADMGFAMADSIATKTLTVSDMLYVPDGFTFGGSSVQKTTLPIVTSFTQALGESAQAVEYTLLTCA